MNVSAIDVITTAVAPIVMVSASGLLFIGIQTKNLHLADRIRDLIREYREAAGAEREARRRAIRAQLALFERRVCLTQRALECVYAAIFCFVITALLLAAAPWVTRLGPSWPLAGAVFMGIAFLLAAIVLELIEMRTGLRTLRIEIGSALDDR